MNIELYDLAWNHITKTNWLISQCFVFDTKDYNLQSFSIDQNLEKLIINMQEQIIYANYLGIWYPCHQAIHEERFKIINQIVENNNFNKNLEKLQNIKKEFDKTFKELNKQLFSKK